MIDWTTVAPAIRTLLSGLATATALEPSFEGDWTDHKSEFIHPAVQKELILRVARVSDFQAHRVYRDIVVTPDEGDPHDELRESIEGMRELVLEVRVEAHEHSEDESRWSWSMLERVRTGLMFQRAIDTLLAVNVGLVSIGPARDVSYTYDKHRVNAAMFEATLNVAFRHDDPIPIGWFERAELTSKLRSPGDVLLPSPPNVTALVVPPFPEPDP